MKISAAVAVTFLAANGAVPIVAQSPTSDIQSAGGLHTVAFRTAEGVVRVQIAADAAPGDTLSGVVLAEPAGQSADERQDNLGELNGLVVESQGERQAVGGGRYRWSVPAALRSGRWLVTLRAANGRIVSRAEVPVDGVRAPVVSGGGDPEPFELPNDGQAGQPAVIRGTFEGTLDGVAVTVGDSSAPLLAASPRRVVFTTPGGRSGNVPLRITANGMVAEGTMRVIVVQLSATNTELARGQTATLTARVSGLQNIESPVTLTLANRSTGVVRLEGGESQSITVGPVDVGPAGEVNVTRTLTGIRPGGFQVTMLAVRNPMSQFDVAAASERVLASWQVATGVQIPSPVRQLIERSVIDAAAPLSQFLAQQQVNRADVVDLFAALLSHYCFDLRDGQTQGAGRAELPVRSGIQLVRMVRQLPQAPRRELTAGDVERTSFGQFLTALLNRFSGAQPVGYLFISSVPANAGITIDGQRKSEMTNRRFVTSIGDHAIVIASPARTCRQRVQVGAFQTSVVACE
jgi:hypothetical protein